MNTLSNEKLEHYAANTEGPVKSMARELLALRKEREAAVPVAWRYRYTKPGVTDSSGQPWVSDWRYVQTESECNPEPNYERQALYVAPPAQPVAVPDELLAAMEEVLRISDRNHEAWHRARDGIASCRAAMTAQPTKANNVIGQYQGADGMPHDIVTLGRTAGKGEPVSQPYKLSEDIAAIRNSGVAIDADKIQAERDALNSPEIPDGYALVPIEPTDEMCDIGHIGVDVLTGVTEDNEYYSINGPDAAKVYRAMLAAAPDFREISNSSTKHFRENAESSTNGWIKCSERMPDEGAEVYIFCDSEWVLEAQYREGDFYDVVRDGSEIFETVSRCVSHWQPRPQKPAAPGKQPLSVDVLAEALRNAPLAPSDNQECKRDSSAPGKEG